MKICYKTRRPLNDSPAFMKKNVWIWEMHNVLSANFDDPVIPQKMLIAKKKKNSGRG
ncbi:MAG: hypothetical protein ABFC71_03330 [Methanoregula sp.]